MREWDVGALEPVRPGEKVLTAPELIELLGPRYQRTGLGPWSPEHKRVRALETIVSGAVEDGTIVARQSPTIPGQWCAVVAA